MRLELEPRWGRLRGGWGEAVGIAEWFHLAWGANHYKKYGQEDKAIEETQKDQGEKNQEEISGKAKH